MTPPPGGPRRPRPAPDGAGERAGRALEILRDLARGFANARALDRSSVPARIEVRFDLDVGAHPAPGAARDLLAHLDERVESSLRAASALRFGAVHCFFCDSSHCAHARPRESDEVFDGYAATGRPRWIDLPAVLLARRDPRVETLYAREGLVAVVDEGAALSADLIDAFARGASAYAILGQVAVGFFETPGRDSRANPVAASLQVVRSDAGDGRIRLHLNVVSAGNVADGAGAARSPAVAGILRNATRRLASIEREAAGAQRRTGAPPDPAPRVLTLLRSVARDLEHHDRVGLRRTAHGRRRSDLGVRPTALAFPEAREADDDRVFADARSKTIVVLGRAGRVHVFAPDGRHVTSVVFRGDEIARRIRTNHWKPADRDAIAAFRARLGTGRDQHRPSA